MIRVSDQGRKRGPGDLPALTVMGAGCGTERPTSRREGRQLGADGCPELLCEKAKEEESQGRSRRSGVKPVKSFDLHLKWMFASLELAA